MTMTHALTSPTGEFSLILPGTWAAIPLGDAEAMRKRVAAVVKKQVPRADRLARARQQIREELLRSAGEAARVGAIIYSIALEMLPGVPFSASLVAFSQDWPPASGAVSASGMSASDRRTALEKRLIEALSGGTILVAERSVVLRRSTLRQETVAETSFPSLDLEYWFATPDDRLLSFLITVPMCEHEKLFTEFFDSVADSVRWSTPRET